MIKAIKDFMELLQVGFKLVIIIQLDLRMVGFLPNFIHLELKEDKLNNKVF